MATRDDRPNHPGRQNRRGAAKGRGPGPGTSERPASARPGDRSPSRGSFEATEEADTRPGLKARQVAAKLLSAVVDQHTSLDGLTDPDHGHPHFRQLEARDQGLVRAILSTALRFRGTIEAALAARLDRPLPGNAASLRHILHVGAAQTLFLDVPDSAAVDLAVAAAEADPRARRFKGLVNALLRRIARESGKGEDALAGDPALDCPSWFFARLEGQWSAAAARAIAESHRRPAPIDLTVKADAASWAERLGGRVVGTVTVRLDQIDGPVTALPGFDKGAWWVQDAAAALPARVFGDLAGKRAADLCAAPGGKTAQLALAGASVTACEISASRTKRLRRNLDRLQLAATIHEGAFATLPADASFDAVLLDAPCSSTGTARRHPDVPYTKSPEEIDRLAKVQAGMLGEAARLVAPGGRLVFSNCSIDRTEGEDVVAAFLADHGDFVRDPIAADEVPGFEAAVSEAGELRTLPSMLAEIGGADGFYAARLVRRG